MLTMVTGGSGSGKSAFAEGLVAENPNSIRYYIATMKPWDDECKKRIFRHQQMRLEKGFETIEHYGNLEQVLLPLKQGTVLVECLSNLTANLCSWQENDGEEQLADELMKGILHIANQANDVVIVSNEVFSDGERYEESTRRYCRILGRLNCLLAASANQVVEIVYGIPIWHKGGAK